MRTTARRRARELALQGLYQWQLSGASAAQVMGDLEEADSYAKADREFLGRALPGAIEKSEQLRERVAPFAARKWGEVSPVERAILLLGAWELAHCPETPYRVAISEAIELAKRYGGTDGHKFVNGILDRVAAQERAVEVATARAKSA